MLEILKVMFLGIVEGITEWLPISSTGHMILVEEFIQLNVSADFMEMFRVVIQLGAILAVVVLYFPKLWPFCSPRNGWIKRDTWALWFRVLAAVLPAAAIGIPFDDMLDEMFYNPWTVAVTLILYGVLFIVVENRNQRKRPRVTSLEDLTWSLAIGIGIFQVLSLIPGTSRSGATILGAILLGASRSKHDPIVSKGLKIIFLNIANEKPDGEDGDEERGHHADGQEHQFRAGEGKAELYKL